MLRSALTEQWRLEAPGGSCPAEVPGSVHTDLMAAGVIEDPYRGLGEEQLRWMYDVDWRYSTVLSAPPPQPGERVDLVFGGIDTVGVVRLGVVELGRTFNMHRSYRFDVGSHLRGSPLPLTLTARS